ncbi:MAG: hypothetical protein P8Y18_10025 [Candidatus Bathyarchaeota archaeon]
MKFNFSKNSIGFAKQPGKRSTKDVRVSQYFVITEIELLSLVFCVMLDITEYVSAVLTMPLIGDVFDIVGIIFCIFIFRWIGLLSLVELLPGADIFPIYIITWLIWYFMKKTKKQSIDIQI